MVRTTTNAIPVDDRFGVTADAKMPFLTQALDPLEVGNRFRSQLDLARGGAVPEARDIVRAIQVIRYKPERRCLIAYQLNGSVGEHTTLIGKVRARGLDRRTYRTTAGLWRAGFRDDSPDGIAIPKPVGVVPDFQMWLQRRVLGIEATHLLAQPGAPELAWRIAAAAAKVHQAGAPTERRHSMEDELRILSERLSLVAEIRPEWSGRLQRLMDACERLAQATPVSPYCGIHRDFYPSQVLVDGPRLYLLDFDLYCLGDPALDIGNFLAHVTEQSLRTLGDPAALVDWEQALEDEFIKRSPGTSPTAIQTYKTLTLARQIHISTRIPERRPYTKSLLELCEQRLGH